MRFSEHATRAILISAFLGACAEPAAAPVPELTGSGNRGETCQAWDDCGEGLACINQVCVIDEFPISANANACEYIECTIPEQCCNASAFDCEGIQDSCKTGDLPACTLYRTECACRITAKRCEAGRCEDRCVSVADCCPELNMSFCFELEQQCAMGESTACNTLSAIGCDCDTTQLACSPEGQCQPKCVLDEECASGVCQAGRCVECRDDGDCPTGFNCFGFTCIETCDNSTNCPAFHSCDQFTSVCSPTGCLSNQECVAYLSNVLAYCEGGTCKEPCLSDLDCDDPLSYNHMKCENNVCVFIGCSSDEECKILNAPGGAPGKGEWLCVQAPGTGGFEGGPPPVDF